MDRAVGPHFYTGIAVRLHLTSSLWNRQIKSHMGVGISRKSMVGFEGLWTHNNFSNFFGPEVKFENDLKIRFLPICIL